MPPSTEEPIVSPPTVESEATLAARLAACRHMLRDLGRVVVAFSAGADSTLLLALAVETLGSSNVVAAMGVSPSLPAREREAGRRLARQLGAELVEVETEELSNPDYVRNAPDRCFHCKTVLYRRLAALAAERGSAVVCGANADDPSDFRPGLQAGLRLGVRAPLLEAGLTKAAVREVSRRLGLRTWDKPASPCLASRIPYGEAITAETIARIERAECVLQDLGFAPCRVRDHGRVARIEVPEADLERLVGLRCRITQTLRELGYTYVTVDLAGFRSGSMNQVLGR